MNIKDLTDREKTIEQLFLAILKLQDAAYNEGWFEARGRTAQHIKWTGRRQRRMEKVQALIKE